MITLNTVHEALALRDFDAEAAHFRMFPNPRSLRAEAWKRSASPRQAGVLVLLYPHEGDLHIMLTRRTETLRGHSGQISFPGGRRDPEDRNFVDTALRETHEELGIAPSLVTVLGTLATIYIPPSDFEVFPSVGVIEHPPVITPNPDEVAEVFSLALPDLLDDRTIHEETREFSGVPVQVPYFLVNGHKVWGATAIMLSEFKERLRAVAV